LRKLAPALKLTLQVCVVAEQVRRTVPRCMKITKLSRFFGRKIRSNDSYLLLQVVLFLKVCRNLAKGEKKKKRCLGID